MDSITAEAGIEDALRFYFDGLYMSDTGRLAKAFHPEARYVSATGGALVNLGMAEYLPIVAARPSPESRGEARRDRIVSIELAGPVTAAVRVECSIGLKFFTDLLTMVRLDGRWQIIAKVFHHEPLPEAA
jgi:4-oxalocrotonate tautomerase